MPRIDEIAFDSERKRMTTLHETLDGRISFTKGSPDEILERCRYVWSNGKTAAFSAAAREQAKRGLAEMTEAGLRVLAIGMHPKAAQMEESGLTLSLIHISSILISAKAFSYAPASASCGRLFTISTPISAMLKI